MDPITYMDREAVLKILNTDKPSMERDIRILKEWIKKQPHLPQETEEDAFYENVLVRNKCRVEKAKTCIDAYYTFRSIWPDLFENLGNLVPSKCNAIVLPLRRLTNNKERLILVSLKNPDVSLYNVMDFTDMFLAVSEILLREDYNTGIRIISDNKNFNVACVHKISPSLLKRIETIFLDAYANRVTGIHFIDQAAWVTLVIGLLKLILPKKIFARINIHPNHESLCAVIPREYLPEDYGGDDKPVEELMSEWDAIFSQHKRRFTDMLKVTSNEAHRVECKYSTQFGVEGTFKSLNID